MKSLLLNGSDWPLEELDNERRAEDVSEALTFGNHKGATSQPDLLQSLVESDVHHGYSLPLPLSKVSKIPGLLMAPMNIQKQNTIDETGKIVEKDRLTHDQSFRWRAGGSVNDRVDRSALMPCMFGKCLMRLINWAVAARKKYPNLPILASNVDYKSAFRRCHLNARTAVQTCT